jgi:Ran GTPase-activating protein (RanGAP) involved in mRNA processing and transport
MLLDIGKYQEDGNAWQDLFKVCKAGRNPPKVPAVFNEELMSKGFSVPQDLLELQQQYRETFQLVMEGVMELAFSNLDWIDDEAVILSEALPYCCSVEKIDLKSNDICAAGAAAVFRSASHCPKLEVISMTKNHLGDAGARAISGAMLDIPRLRTLWLNECHIGDSGIEAMMLQLPRCNSLRNLYVFDNVITDEGAEAVIDCLPRCWLLVQLGIGGNPLSQEIITRLQKAWDMVSRPPGHAIYLR